MSVLDSYDKFVSDTTVSIFGMDAVPVGVAIYAGLPFVVGSVLGHRKAGALVSVALCVRMLLKQKQIADNPSFQAP